MCRLFEKQKVKGKLEQKQKVKGKLEPLSLGESCADYLKAPVSEIWDALLLKAFNDKQCYLSHPSHL